MKTLKIIEDLLEREGGYVDNPDDRGGPTKFGITLETLRKWRRDNKLTFLAIKFMDVDEARLIYAYKYIEEPGFNLINNKQVREVVVDAGVMSGPTRVTRWLQTLVRVKVDGNLGPITAAKVNSRNSHEIVRRFSVWRIKFYVRIAKKNESQLKFLEGWINRATSFLLY